MPESKRQIVILGNGVAGITAARHIRKRSDDEILVISGESDHFFSRTALMYIYMGHMAFDNTKPYEDHFWEQNNIRLMRAWVEAVDVENKLLKLQGPRDIPYDVLILATGSASNRFGWPGQDLRGVQGLYSLQDLQQMETDTAGIDHAVIVGGGLIGVEMAEMLHSRDIGVTFLVREASWMSHILPPEESEMVVRHLREWGIDLRLSTELDRIEPDAHGKVRAALTKDGETIDCQFLGLTVGVHPNIAFLRPSGIELDRGILVDDQLRTSDPSIYAIGDCAQLREPKPGRRPVEALWYTGRMMGETVARILCGEPDRTYDPGIWFNSAKFFDLEYQVYGTVPTRCEEGVSELYWEHASGKKSLRVVFRDDPQRTILGFNLMGIRYRHEVCEDWVREERSLRYVLENLGVANFDPEFYAQHEQDLVAVYNQRFPDEPLTLKRKRGLANLFRLRRSTTSNAA